MGFAFYRWCWKQTPNVGLEYLPESPSCENARHPVSHTLDDDPGSVPRSSVTPYLCSMITPLAKISTHVKVCSSSSFFHHFIGYSQCNTSPCPHSFFQMSVSKPLLGYGHWLLRHCDPISPVASFNHDTTSTAST